LSYFLTHLHLDFGNRTVGKNKLENRLSIPVESLILRGKNKQTNNSTQKSEIWKCPGASWSINLGISTEQAPWWNCVPLGGHGHWWYCSP